MESGSKIQTNRQRKQTTGSTDDRIGEIANGDALKHLVEDLVLLEKEVSREKGDALFLREDAEKWDVVASAPWIGADEKAALTYLATLMQERLKPTELLAISRVVLIDADNPALKAIQKTLNVQHNAVEVKDSNFFGLQINLAYIITAKRGGEVSAAHVAL